MVFLGQWLVCSRCEIQTWSSYCQKLLSSSPGPLCLSLLLLIKTRKHSLSLSLPLYASPFFTSRKKKNRKKEGWKKMLEYIEERWTTSFKAAQVSWLCKLYFNKYFETVYFDWLARKTLHSYWELKYDFECFCTKTMHCMICQNSLKKSEITSYGLCCNRIDLDDCKIYSSGCYTLHNSG